MLGDVLELTCGGGGCGGGGGGGEKKRSSTVSKIGVVTGVAIIRSRWAQRSSQSTVSLVANNVSADSTTSTTSSEGWHEAKGVPQLLVAVHNDRPTDLKVHVVRRYCSHKIWGQQSCKCFILKKYIATQCWEDADFLALCSEHLTWLRQKPNLKIHEFNIAKEQHAMQPCSAVFDSGPGLSHQSRSYACGDGGRVLSRNPSITSQDFPDTAVGSSPQRGSSPQIRAYGPDGRHYHHDLLQAASSYPPNRSSRSPSPARAASLDARCGSPAGYIGSIQSEIASPSQASLSSTATGTASSCGSARDRCLSPLLIPPPRPSISDPASGPPASPLGSLQPDLYLRRDGPVFLNARRTGKSLGRLHLRLKYDFDKSDLHVHLIEAHNLAGCDQGGFNDPYVKLTLSPEVDSRKRQTPIHRNDPNPFFDQHFKFPVSYEELQDKTLALQVFDYDRFSRNDVVGSVKVAMDQLELVSSSSSVEVWGEIARERKPPEEIQEVLLSLSYLPSAERLTVVILKARNLFPLEGKESLDPFVKVSLLSGEKRVKKRKTAIRRSTMSPVWNEALSFNVSAGSLASSAIEVCVLDSSSELIGSKAIVGCCIVGPGASGSNPGPENGNESREHWLNMTHSPRKGVAMWHTLR